MSTRPWRNHEWRYTSGTGDGERTDVKTGTRCSQDTLCSTPVGHGTGDSLKAVTGSHTCTRAQCSCVANTTTMPSGLEGLGARVPRLGDDVIVRLCNVISAVLLTTTMTSPAIGPRLLRRGGLRRCTVTAAVAETTHGPRGETGFRQDICCAPADSHPRAQVPSCVCAPEKRVAKSKVFGRPFRFGTIIALLFAIKRRQGLGCLFDYVICCGVRTRSWFASTFVKENRFKIKSYRVCRTFRR